MRSSVPVVTALATSVALAWGCSTADDRLGIEIEGPPPAPFAVDEAGADADRGLVSYCPTDKCPSGWTTCPNSRFPCDVNLWTDVDNCGACGRACPGSSTTGSETFSCVDGVCVMQCSALPLTLDCDGLADNGCEANPIHNQHCGSCGKKCTDPAKPCADQTGLGAGDIDCGCPPDKLYCSGRCVDHKNDNTSCGDCFTFCDATGGGAPSYPNSHYGCRDGHCGALKCNELFGDCDGSITTGCETSLVTSDNCGGCGRACPEGQGCYLNENLEPECMCPPGLTLCTARLGRYERGRCVDLTSDTYNCGACDASCFNGLPSAQRACNFGTCVMRCSQGHADCNNSQADGCEVSTDSDPRNCGGCGKICDAIAGQACVAGRCVVEPCNQDAGGAAR